MPFAYRRALAPAVPPGLLAVAARLAVLTAPLPPTRRILKLARVNGEDCVYDLGCGDGRICIAAAQLGASAVGVEIEPDLVAEFEKAVQTEKLHDRVRCICGGAPYRPSLATHLRCISQVAIACLVVQTCWR